jgi:phenylpropionate dioxygenase-like ring-hydroxylating dioxygenase large terminal subunit
LKPVRLEPCGDLIFVTLSEQTPPLRQWLDPFYDSVADAFTGPLWKMAEAWEFDCPCNWKVPTENTLESYHISEVHPTWLGGQLPEEENSHHHLEGRYSTLEYRCDSAVERRQAELNRFLGGQPKIGYRHWQVHPNVTFVMTDSFNYLATCVPRSATTCRVRTRMFPIWGTRSGPRASLYRQVNWRIARRTIRRVFEEDRTVFEPQQRGIEASRHPGVIGNREERIFQFQQYVCRRTGIPVEAAEPEQPEASASRMAKAK